MTVSLFFAFIVGALVFGLLAGGIVFLRLRTKIFEKETELAAALAENQLLKQQRVDNDTMSKHMSERFELVAAKIFEDKSGKLGDQNLKSLGTLLEPFKERLKDFEKKVEETYSTERSERGTLRGELSKLMELNVKMSSEAENLTKALKGDNKIMGNWGEMILENILDRSGLRKNQEYTLQGSDLGALKNDQGESIRPDVIINLPDGKHIIVDSKVSLTAYETYAQAEDKETQEKWARAHVESLERHIKGLSDKKYYSAEQLISPDFVILFMPIEPAFALAFKHKPDLLQYAWDRNIALVSPTTLLTTLKTVATIWKQERQEQNAKDIALRGGALYDKFVGFVEDLEDLGKKVDSVQKSHAQVMNKLSEGSGNLVRQVEMLKELGAKAEKKISQKLLNADQ